jgi:microcystin-dependent protein
MSNQYVGEIRAFGFSFAPRDWAFCDGAPQSIANNSTLFAVIGTIYGGDGQNTFNLPDMRGRMPMHQGNGSGLTPRVVGDAFGIATVTLLQNQMPQHNHVLEQATLTTQNPAQNSASPGNTAYFGISSPGALYSTVNPDTQLSSQAIGTSGASQPHDNLQPLLALNFCIALFGIFPTRN